MSEEEKKAFQDMYVVCRNVCRSIEMGRVTNMVEYELAKDARDRAEVILNNTFAPHQLDLPLGR